MEKINIARECLQIERTALEERKLKMEKERERLKWKFDAEVAILGEKTKIHVERCRESEKSEERMVKERGELVNQQEEVEREKKTAFNVKEMQKEKNKALLERERSLHKNEDELVKAIQKCCKEEDRIKRANLNALRKQAKSECRFASEKVAFSKEQETQAKRWEKENEIHKVRELDQQKKAEKLKRDKKISSTEKEFIRDRNQSLLKKETYVSSIEVTIRTDLKAIFKRENTVGNRENAVEKREKEVEKTVAKQKKTGERLAMERVGLEKAQMQAKRDGESVFERETKLWREKKGVGQ